MDLATAHGIEESDIFLAIVTESFMAEGQRQDEIAYAKNLGKPFALAIEEGVDPSNWFDGCNVIGKITFNRHNLNDKEIGDWLFNLRRKLMEGKQ